MKRFVAVAVAVVLTIVGALIILSGFKVESKEVPAEATPNPNSHHVEYDLSGGGEKSKLLEHYEEQSKDVIGRMYIPNTSMETALVNTDYYFRRNLDGAYDSGGIPFTVDAGDFNAPNRNCTIYGHRLDDDTDFGMLKSYLTQDFYNEHPTICIETDSGTTEWDIISVFTINVATDSFAYTAYPDMSNTSDRGVFLGEIRNRNLVDTKDYVYQTGDSLITLSTCHYETDIDNGRLVVVAAKHRN